MKIDLEDCATLSCAMVIPVLDDRDDRIRVPVIGIFRASIPAESVDEWVVRSDGTPRSDRELATEVLLAIRRPLGADRHRAPYALSVATILALDSAAAIVVSTFLAAIPRSAGGS
ncbi:hypothetical protein VAPA_1c02660 [Variovorax paradoxus B4]|uniref:Uncharacterized protein n=1 Tax=Variovorax paradoxus B4 TaxID=1246301 RepID=T1X4M4_VARPD|nr:hypothetical protein [Variovorax paradoxus]AGU47396.1 hypothetical protein VAPA_1c02660 [Variovorax paradoxus B4]